MLKLIVGLGNPGNSYKHTRHNVGTWYIFALLNKFHKKLTKNKKFFGYTCQLKINTTNNIYIFISNMYMNICGEAIKKISSFYKIFPNEILIAHDDMNLFPGNIKLKFGGSDYGHNGIKNIIHSLENKKNFYRLRIGIGKPKKNKTTEFVLGKPLEKEKKLIHHAINQAIQCTNILIIQNNINKTMHQLNKKNIKMI
ncbi:MAG: peptidyl-tRNA hydrolase [Candidatus Westeberhardia cardiocondylae]|nr:peptidyl-tRNA hydrolase [Candidatus Westeberhardia cardiocondylae]